MASAEKFYDYFDGYFGDLSREEFNQKIQCGTVVVEGEEKMVAWDPSTKNANGEFEADCAVDLGFPENLEAAKEVYIEQYGK